MTPSSLSASNTNTIPDPRPIFLIGYMGCGKTTLGRALAKAVGREFIDLDFYITQRFHASVSKIFAERGEAEFRRIETDMLREVGEFTNVIVACGGGTPCFNDNITYMNAKGTTIWLEASRERLLERLLRNRSKRPLLASKPDSEIAATIDAGLKARECFYSQAQHRFNGDLLENKLQIEGTIADFLTNFNFLFA